MKNGLIIEEDGSKLWFLNGLLHRVDGPAWELANGTKFWYVNGLRHREDGPAEEWPDGSTFWYFNDLRHREDGPATEWANGNKYWWLNGLLHRVDGPAEELANGSNTWWLNDVELIHPEAFDTMELWIQYLNDNEEQTYQLIHDIDGFIEFIDNPSDKQMRVHQMRWVI